MENRAKHKPLPVTAIIGSAFLTIANSSAALLKRLWIAGFLLLILQLIEYYEPLHKSLLLNIGYLIAYGVASTLFAVTCHRFILLGSDSVPNHGVLSWSKREWRFFGWGFVAYFYFVIMSMFAFLVISAFSTASNSGLSWLAPIFIIGIIPGLYIFSRLWVLLPSAAIGERNDIGWAWGITERNGWRMTAIVGILPAAFFIPTSFLLDINFAIDCTIIVLGLVFLAVEISALSLSYRFLTENNVSEYESS